MRMIAIGLALVAMAGAQTISTAQRRADLEWVKTELPRRHPNLFAVTPRADFERTAAVVEGELAALTDTQFVMRLAALVALGRDAHTSVAPGGALFPALSTAVRWFDDGVFVTASVEVSWNAARVLAINGVPVEEALERLRPVISYENELWFRYIAQSHLANLGVLRGVGLVGENEPARLTLRLTSGEVRTVEVGAREGSLIRPVQQTPGFTPALLRNLNENYWAEYWPATKTLYIAYRRCAETPTKRIAQFANEITELARRGPVERAVIDLRGNTGGNSRYFEELMTGLQEPLGFLAFQPGFRAYGLIDRGTFSSGMLAAVFLRRNLSGIVPLYGEPTGGSPLGYGEVLAFTLPGSGLTGQHSTRLFNTLDGQTTVTPDVAVGLRSTDYFARQDPLLAMAMAGAGPVSAQAAGEVVTWNAASLRPDSAIAPGGLATAFAAFGEAPGAVRVNGVPAEVLGATPSQVSFVVPAALEAGPATVEAGGKTGRFFLRRWAPALFSAEPGNPLQPAAAEGREGTVRLYATGLRADTEVKAWVAEQPAEVARVEPVAGVAGLWMIETKLPENVSGFVPVFVATGSVASNAVALQLP